MTDRRPAGVIVPVPVPPSRIDFPAPVSLNTWAMWLFVLSPAIEVVVLILLTAVAALLAATGDPAAYSIAIAIDSRAATLGITALVIVARVLLARSDRRTLERLGVPQPMAWGWGLLAVVYVIGRGVVLHRRVGRGAMLTWIGVGVIVVAQIVDRSGVYDQVASLILG